MLRLLRLSLILISAVSVLDSAAARERFTFRTVAKDLYIPWELIWGPDNMFWVTERNGVVSRIDPATGAKHVILDMRDSVEMGLENGLLGIALHPRMNDVPHVWLSYVRRDVDTSKRTLSRYTYVNDTLIDPVHLLQIDTAGEIHQGSRMMISPDEKLFVTMGDGNQPHHVQDTSTLLGKLLRFNLDGTIPNDNPYPGNPLWTIGHRNQQGLVMLPDGRIFTSEHGSVLEDEVNEIIKGRNYGWPYSEGPCDEDDEKPYCRDLNVKEPIWSTGPDVTYGVSELGFYDNDRYPILKNSLILLSLKQSTIYQLRFDEARTSIIETIPMLSFSAGRLRALCITPDGRIFVTTSNRDPNFFAPFPREDDDKILELIPVGEGARPIYRALQEDVTVNGRINSENFGTFSIANDGDAPLTIDRVFYDGWTTAFFNAQWRLPVVVLPGETYPINVGFMPQTEGTFEDRLELHEADADVNHAYPIYGITIPTSVIETRIDGLHVGPNPFDAGVTFRTDEPADITVVITDILGRVIWTGASTATSSLQWPGTVLGAGDCPPGSYHATVTIDDRTTGTLLLRR